MTQQQKIAAALMKAGISNPAAWSAAGITPSILQPGEPVEWICPFNHRLRPTPRGRPDEGRKESNLPDLLAEPAGDRPLARLEMYAHDLGRTGAYPAVSVRPAYADPSDLKTSPCPAGQAGAEGLGRGRSGASCANEPLHPV